MNSSPDIKELMAKADIPTDSDKSSQDKGWKRAFSYLKEALAWEMWMICNFVPAVLLWYVIESALEAFKAA